MAILTAQQAELRMILTKQITLGRLKLMRISLYATEKALDQVL